VLQFPDISYSFYPVYCDLYGIRAQTIQLELDYTINLDRFEPNAGGIVFPNPNAPTAMDVSTQSIEQLLARHTEQVLLVDEAYADFGAQSVVPLIKQYSNLLVSHTFSKGRSLAGMRLGVAFGHKDLIEGLQRVKNSFNSYPVDALAQVAGVASMQDEGYYRSTMGTIMQTREDTVQALRERGFEVLPSSANFVFARPPANATNDSANRLFQKLDNAGVLVRYWSKPKLDQWLRISIGTNEEMQKLMNCFDA
jgi:histidinol-phosphate aminotransferase